MIFVQELKLKLYLETVMWLIASLSRRASYQVIEDYQLNKKVCSTLI